MTTAPSRRAVLAALKIVAVVVLIVAANHGVDYLKSWLHMDIRPSNEVMIHRMIMLTALLYAVALAMPFVPGVEIGVGLIMLLGVKIVPLVYLCTLSGLVLAYLVGWLIPTRVLTALARDLRLGRIAALLERFDNVPHGEKLAFFLASSPGRYARFLLRYRYVALAIAVNVPGNFIIGGGGGIALMSGISRLFSPPLFVLTIAIAVSPVPLLVLLFGPSYLAQ